MANLDEVLTTKYETSFSTLKNTSHDSTNDIYMCQSKMQVIDFDHLTRELFTQKHPASPDALWSDEDLKNIYEIEFKNQEKSKVKNQNVQKKAKDGKNTLDKICSENSVPLEEYKLIYCVAYKSNPNKREYSSRYDESSIHFGLKSQEGMYFDKVITNNIDFFTQEFKRSIFYQQYERY